jgi:hypothetical protein
MSSTSSQELAGSVSGLNELECEQSRSARSIHIAEQSSPSTGPIFHAIETSGRSPASRQTSSAEASHASHSAQPPEDAELRKTFGPTCSVLSPEIGQHTSSPKMSKKRQSPTHQNVSSNLVTARTTAVYRGLIAGQTIREIVGGLLHTPTRKANFVAPSMQKWPSCRRYVEAFGGQRITREQFEFLNGYPIGWTRLDSSEMPSSRRYRKPSGERS